jgi:hypothetical protein
MNTEKTVLKSITDHEGTTYLYDEDGNISSYRDRYGTIYNVEHEVVGQFNL